MEQFFNLLYLIDDNAILSEKTIDSFPTNFLKITADICFYTRLQVNAVPRTWVAFITAIKGELLPGNYERGAFDAFRFYKKRLQLLNTYDGFVT